MAITLSDSRLGTTGTLGGMMLGPLGAGPSGAAELRQTQEVLEVAQEAPLSAGVRETQEALEWAGHNPPATAIRETQAALEITQYPPNELWATQVCLEVALPASGFAVLKRNHSFIKAWMGTGHMPNASFNS